MTTEQRDRLFVLNGMAYHLRDEFVSTRTRELQDAYDLACRRQIPYLQTMHSKALEASKASDLTEALKSLAERSRDQGDTLMETYPPGTYSYTLWYQTPNGHRFSSVSYRSLDAAHAGVAKSNASDTTLILHRVKPHDADGEAMWDVYTVTGALVGTYPTKHQAIAAVFDGCMVDLYPCPECGQGSTDPNGHDTCHAFRAHINRGGTLD